LRQHQRRNIRGQYNSKVSPALIVPAMLNLREQGFGMNKGIPVIALAGASVDNILAVTLFSIFSAMAVSAQKLVGIVTRTDLISLLRQRIFL